MGRQLAPSGRRRPARQQSRGPGWQCRCSSQPQGSQAPLPPRPDSRCRPPSGGPEAWLPLAGPGAEACAGTVQGLAQLRELLPQGGPRGAAAAADAALRLRGAAGRVAGLLRDVPPAAAAAAAAAAAGPAGPAAAAVHAGPAAALQVPMQPWWLPAASPQWRVAAPCVPPPADSNTSPRAAALPPADGPRPPAEGRSGA
jgi:hypothetical protein